MKRESSNEGRSSLSSPEGRNRLKTEGRSRLKTETRHRSPWPKAALAAAARVPCTTVRWPWAPTLTLRLPTRCHTPELARDSAPSNPGSGRRGDAVIPFEDVSADRGCDHLLALPGALLGRHPAARQATHCPARPATPSGVTAPPQEVLTNGGMWTPPCGQARTQNRVGGSGPGTVVCPAS